MEVFLSADVDSLEARGFLHLCGGVSNPVLTRRASREFSPLVWRCFLTDKKKRRSHIVFSTCVEVFLRKAERQIFEKCFLHVCGGVSISVL